MCAHRWVLKINKQANGFKALVFSNIEVSKNMPPSWAAAAAKAAEAEIAAGESENKRVLEEVEEVEEEKEDEAVATA